MSESFTADSNKTMSSNDLDVTAESPNSIDLVKRSDSEHDFKEKLEAIKQLADRYEKQLNEERVYRQELEKSFEKRSKEVEESAQKYVEDRLELEQKLTEMSQSFELKLKQTLEQISEVTAKNTQQREAFNELSNRYQRLAGHYEKTANEMREEQIILPQTIPELQFECLRLHEALIESRATKEHFEAESASEIEILKTELTNLMFRSPNERRSPENNELRHTIGDLEKRLVESQTDCMAMSQSLEEYRQKCKTLQEDYNTAEGVQKDFVKLSQKLQVQLEAIRQGDQELRWQFPEDIRKCQDCESDLKQKLNCKHCGKVYCPKCLENSVFAGQNNREAKVCRVCYTLLQKNTAPFFSSK